MRGCLCLWTPMSRAFAHPRPVLSGVSALQPLLLCPSSQECGATMYCSVIRSSLHSPAAPAVPSPGPGSFSLAPGTEAGSGGAGPWQEPGQLQRLGAATGRHSRAAGLGRLMVTHCAQHHHHPASLPTRDKRDTHLSASWSSESLVGQRIGTGCWLLGQVVWVQEAGVAEGLGCW